MPTLAISMISKLMEARTSELTTESKKLNDGFEKRKKQVASRMLQLKKVYQDNHRLVRFELAVRYWLFL